jgi:CubicO group peptidase (beta-lactamase class C family)
MCASKSPCYSQSLTMTQPERVGLSSERLMRINGYMESVVREGQISGAVVLIARRGKVAYLKTFGLMDIEANRPMVNDALFWIASMTKPVTCTAAMILYEEGRYLLNDPIWRYIPEFKNPKVIVLPASGEQDPESYETIPAKGEIQVRHLLNHTSGISYGTGPHDKIYREAGVKLGVSRPGAATASEMVNTLAGLPLLHEPGEKFTYGYSHDLIGYLIEVLSGESIDTFYREHLFRPLKMEDTGFIIPDEKIDRLAFTYKSGQEGKLEKILQPQGRSGEKSRRIFSGGGGLYSTASDFARFCQMILNGGELDGVRLLSRKTVELMTTNSIGGAYSAFRPTSGDKYGYGFGIRTERDKYNEMESNGTLMWDGGRKTRFWIDPQEQMIGILMTQLRGGNWRIHQIFRNLAYQAIVD